MIIPTIHESHGACKEFVKETQDQAVVVALSAGKPLIVYKSGEERTEALPFTTKEDQESFYRFYIQAKLFNGEIDFNTKEEKYALKKWLLSVGHKEFQTYFEQNILATKPRRYTERFTDSGLFKVFEELKDEKQLPWDEISTKYPPLDVIAAVPEEEVPDVEPDADVEEGESTTTSEVVAPPRPVRALQDGEFESVGKLNFALLQLIENTQISQDRNLENICKMIEANEKVLKEGTPKEKKAFVNMVADLKAAAGGNLDKSSRENLEKLAGRCIAEPKTWAEDVVKFNKIDKAVANAIIFALLKQRQELKGLDLDAWPLVKKWQDEIPT